MTNFYDKYKHIYLGPPLRKKPWFIEMRKKIKLSAMKTNHRSRRKRKKIYEAMNRVFIYTKKDK
jgi:hypothetical protein